MTKTAYLQKIPLVRTDGTIADDHVATLVINRPEAANAFNGDILEDLTAALESVHQDRTCRALLLQGAGKHFSAGADLTWMQASARLGVEENCTEARKLIRMFEALDSLRIPTISVVRGAAYGGAVGLVACTDFAIATTAARFCLSEIRVGLLPAVILPYLSRKIPQGSLRRLTLEARVFNHQEARECHLVQVIAESDQLEQTVREEINQLLQGSPEAQAAYKTLQLSLQENAFRQGEETVKAIAAARASRSGQAGLAAFFDKKPAPWVLQISPTAPILVS